eukprot:scaffold3832_cov36-Cyclotella_meneghiniana.AAC.2
MGLREFVHKLATECYQYLCLRPRPPPDPDSVTHPSLVSEGGPHHASEGAPAIGPHHASEGAQAINVIFHCLRPKLMVDNPWHLNERECGSGETELNEAAFGVGYPLAGAVFVAVLEVLLPAIM